MHFEVTFIVLPIKAVSRLRLILVFRSPLILTRLTHISLHRVARIRPVIIYRAHGVGLPGESRLLLRNEVVMRDELHATIRLNITLLLLQYVISRQRRLIIRLVHDGRERGH